MKTFNVLKVLIYVFRFCCHLQECYSQIIIFIILLNVLQSAPVTFTVQMILQLLSVGQLYVTEVAGDGTPGRKLQVKKYLMTNNITPFNIKKISKFVLNA